MREKVASSYIFYTKEIARCLLWTAEPLTW